jgi:uncharacterized protein (DUF1330 family)
MPKGYWIAHVHVTDPEEYRKYVEGARIAFETHGARFLARGGQYTELEGPQGRERHVVIEFPSYQAALDCYHSDAYQSARAFRAEAGVATLTIVEGS